MMMQTRAMTAFAVLLVAAVGMPTLAADTASETNVYRVVTDAAKEEARQDASDRRTLQAPPLIDKKDADADKVETKGVIRSYNRATGAVTVIRYVQRPGESEPQPQPVTVHPRAGARYSTAASREQADDRDAMPSKGEHDRNAVTLDRENGKTDDGDVARTADYVRVTSVSDSDTTRPSQTVTPVRKGNWKGYAIQRDDDTTESTDANETTQPVQYQYRYVDARDPDAQVEGVPQQPRTYDADDVNDRIAPRNKLYTANPDRTTTVVNVYQPSPTIVRTAPVYRSELGFRLGYGYYHYPAYPGTIVTTYCPPYRTYPRYTYYHHKPYYKHHYYRYPRYYGHVYGHSGYHSRRHGVHVGYRYNSYCGSSGHVGYRYHGNKWNVGVRVRF